MRFLLLHKFFLFATVICPAVSGLSNWLKDVYKFHQEQSEEDYDLFFISWPACLNVMNVSPRSPTLISIRYVEGLKCPRKYSGTQAYLSKPRLPTNDVAELALMHVLTKFSPASLDIFKVAYTFANELVGVQDVPRILDNINAVANLGTGLMDQSLSLICTTDAYIDSFYRCASELQILGPLPKCLRTVTNEQFYVADENTEHSITVLGHVQTRLLGGLRHLAPSNDDAKKLWAATEAIILTKRLDIANAYVETPSTLTAQIEQSYLWVNYALSQIKKWIKSNYGTGHEWTLSSCSEDMRNIKVSPPVLAENVPSSVK